MRCLNCGHNGIPLSTEICPNCGVHLPSLMQGCLKPGTMLWHDTYRIDYPLGRGGFGITYRAFDCGVQRPVAIKEFFPQEYAIRETTTGYLRILNAKKRETYDRGLKRFLEEGHLLASLNHSGVVRVYNSFQENQTAYLAMELVGGGTLRDELDQQVGRKLPSAQVKEIMTELVDALHSVHQKNVYHLDISPDNIMLTPEGKVVLIDFGASRQGLGSHTTQAFKEAYAPPEVINRVGMGPQSDLFELGMTLHELLTGELPPSAIARSFSMGTSNVDPWDACRLDEPWRGLVAGAIRLSPEERPKNVKDWWERSTPVSLPRPPSREPDLPLPSSPNSAKLKKAQDIITHAYIAGLISGVLTLLFTLFSLAGSDLSAGLINIYSFVDVALIIRLTFGIYKKSRVAAVIMFLYFVLSKIYQFSVAPPNGVGVFIMVIFFWCYIDGIRGTFAHHKLMNSERGG